MPVTPPATVTPAADADVTVPLHLSARAIEALRERGFLTVDRPTVWGIEASRHGDARRSLEGQCPGGRSSVIATARGRSRGYAAAHLFRASCSGHLVTS